MKPKIIVTIDGGVVTAIDADREVEVLVLNFDNEGEDEGRLIRVNGSTCNAEIWGEIGVGVSKEKVDDMFEQVES